MTDPMRERLQAIIDWADFAMKHAAEFDSHGVRNLDGPVFDEARAALATLPPPNPERVQRMEQQLRACQLLSGDAIGDYPEGTPEVEIFADIHAAAVRGLIGSLEVTNEAEGIPLPPQISAALAPYRGPSEN